MSSLLCVQILIPATQRQAIKAANDLAAHKLDVEVQVMDHLAQHGKLSRIFLSEVSAFGLHDMKQFRHNRRYAGKVARPRRSIQAISDTGDNDHSCLLAGIHLLRLWSE